MGYGPFHQSRQIFYRMHRTVLLLGDPARKSKLLASVSMLSGCCHMCTEFEVPPLANPPARGVGTLGRFVRCDEGVDHRPSRPCHHVPEGTSGEGVISTEGLQLTILATIPWIGWGVNSWGSKKRRCPCASSSTTDSAEGSEMEPVSSSEDRSWRMELIAIS